MYYIYICKLKNPFQTPPTDAGLYTTALCKPPNLKHHPNQTNNSTQKMTENNPEIKNERTTCTSHMSLDPASKLLYTNPPLGISPKTPVQHLGHH